MLLRKRIGIRATVIAAIFFIAAGVFATGVAVWKIRSDAVEDAYKSTGNFAAVLSDQMARSVGSIDHMLTALQSSLFAIGIANASDLMFLSNAFGYAIVKSQLEDFPDADVVSILGADGRVIVNSRNWPSEPIDGSDHELLQGSSFNDDPGTYISEPVISRSSGKTMLFFARRICARIAFFWASSLSGFRLIR